MSTHDIESLVELLERSVHNHGPRALFLSKVDGRWVETTYAEFGKTVDALRAGLARLGVGEGDGVGIISGNRVEWAATAYATYGLGAALVPMYESQHVKDWAFIVRDSAIKVLLVADAAIYAKIEPLLRTLPTLERIVLLSGEGAPMSYASLLAHGRAHPKPALQPSRDTVATLLYTSGTTGEPKGVVLSHGNILANVLTLQDLVLASDEKPEEHRTLSFLPWAHAFGHTCELHGIVCCGGSMAIAESIDKIADNLRETQPTVLIAVPRLFLRIYNGVDKAMTQKSASVRRLFQRGIALSRRKNQGELLTASETCVLWLADALVFRRVRARFGGRLRFALSGAAALSREAAEFIDALGIAVYEGYGLTETSPIATANVPGHRKIGSVGRAIPGVSIAIDQTATDQAAQGEIVIYGPNVMLGYHNREQDSRAVLTADGGLRTGDLGYLDAEGYLFITGRIKEQYKLANGKYVAPAALEERLKASPFIENVMIHGANQTHNVALVVPEAENLRGWASEAGIAHASLEELCRDERVNSKLRAEIDRLSAEFKGYERIQAFTLLTEDFTQDNEMLTPSMKLKRQKVVERWSHEIERLYTAETGTAAKRAAGHEARYD